ncbi:MCE family protein [Actinomadura sp. GC306]|uniref:MCE family protein n=1 Tax=Actinomadura sp. GC306 TaxID=2530367 RepID=UPI001043A77C|nr:MCE family protein [Actinomadura sp. GC306]TDC63381.1 MCE family protein [Actinomadura sp. GC306]
MRVPTKVLALCTAATVLAAGCSTRIEDIPLPGGADLGDHPYTVKVQFEDVLNLVPQAAVRVNDVPVGRVKEVSLPKGSWDAEVTLLVNGDVRLPANANANLEQSSLLGEKYIELSAPAEPSAQRLADGATIPVARTSRNADVEEVFGALSLLLSGGGLPQIRTINRELNQALGGREDTIRSALRNLDELTSTLNRNRESITTALDGLNRLSSTVRSRNGQVETVLDDLSPGLKVLEDQRGQLVEMLRALEKLSDVAVKTINASRDDTAANLRSLAVILEKLADSGRDLPKSMEVLLTFPFTDEALKAVKGDYLNGYLTVVAAEGFNCVVPPVKEEPPMGTSEEDPAEQGLGQQLTRAGTLAGSDVPGPRPEPCPTTGGGQQVNAPSPEAPRQVAPQAPPDGPGAPGDAPPLPLPTLGEGD